MATLHVWISDLYAALQGGDELSRRCSGVASQGARRAVPEAPDKAGWFLTTSVAARHWLETKKSAELGLCSFGGVWHIINNTIYNASNSDIPAKRVSTDEEGITE
ncbi:hypothetical protein OsJ_36011 [Oryza sativa Japonica Group]|uniref:Uncharacterized protein n=1 Tax=Oryza sativa subsp. japonica TaxID=39947 RepID=B9GD14_ORYSJ|nr:hypothetical protein OsJ_36011 [Oryza sativa Japonica Group]